MAADAMKRYLHDYLRDARQSMLDKVDGLAEYDARRPLTMTGTNLLGLVKHLAIWEARYFGAVFGRPFPEPLPRWDLESERFATMWATEHEARADVIDRYHRACGHSDATIDALALDHPGHVEWWPSPEVTLFDVLVHMIAETSRHADILREEIDGAVGPDAEAMARRRHDAAFWEQRRAEVERAARAAGA